MSGFTTGQGGSGAEQGGYGGVKEGQSEESEKVGRREAQGYGGKSDQDTEIGA